MTTTAEPAARRYNRVLQAFTEKPWAILPSKFGILTEILVLHLEGRRFEDEELSERIAGEQYNAAYLAARNGGGRQKAPSVAVVPIYGVITPRASMFSKMSGGTGMDEFMNAINQAASDSNVASILLDIDSPGGQVDLVPEAAAAIRAARQQKPVVAVANTMAASAAYWLASQATELVVSPSGEVGSVGVFAGHEDLSEAMAVAGIKQTLIHAGKYKVELASSAPLSEEARAYVQETVDAYYSMFTSDIAKGRKVPVGDARGAAFGEGRMVMAQKAVQQGMADRVDTFDNTLARLLRGAGVKNGTQAQDEDGRVWITNFAGQIGSTATNGWLDAEMADEHANLFAGPIQYKKTDVVDEPWDGPGEEAKMPNPAGSERCHAMYAWVDPDGDEDQKGSYKFPHHMVGSDGDPGAANVNGVRNALSRLSQANIPESDRAGVEAHLQHHLDDFNAANGTAGEGQAAESPQEPLAGLRQNSRTARISEREQYLSLLRRINK